MRAVTTETHEPVRLLRWQPLLPLGLSIVFGSVLMLISTSNLNSVKKTAEQVRQGRALDLALQAKQSLASMRYLSDMNHLRAALKNIVQGPIQSVALTDSKGRIVMAEPSHPLDAKSQRLIRDTHASGGFKAVVKRKDGPHPTYEIVLMLKPKVPESIAKHFMRLFSKLPPSERTGWAPTLGPLKIFVRTLVTVHDDASVESVRRARRTRYASFGVTGLLLVFSLMALVTDRRQRRFHRAMQRRRALAEMGEMAAVLAHEIRNPVGIIKGRAQLLLEDDQSVTPKTLQTLVEQSQRLERLVGTLLEFARPSPPSPEELDGEKLVESATESVAEVAIKKQIAIVPDVTPGAFRADADQVYRVLVNLLRNALEATPERGRITVSLRYHGEMAVFKVTDTGPGLPSKLGDEIFKPFVTTRQKGSGLGLAVVRRIVESHGGQMSAGNGPQGGALVEVRFPREGLVKQLTPSNQEDSHG
jgi:signal transduction histidine kinase